MPNDTPKVDLNVYLAKANCEPGDAIKKANSLQSIELDIGMEQKATLLIRRAKSKPPRWAAFFQDYVDQSRFGQNSSTGAVLLVPVEARMFLPSFGQGWHNIDSAKIESDFGLKTALNLLDPLSIRSIDKASLEAQPRQLREQSGQATELQYFGIDIECDLLRAVTGKPKDPKFGSRLSGLDALKLAVDIDPDGLSGLLKSLLLAFGSNDYKNGPFAWIDHIGQVRDPSVCAELNAELIAKLRRGELDKIWLSVPEIVDWNRVAGFRYSMGKRAPRVHDVRVSELLDTFKDEPVSLASLLTRKIYCVDSDDNPVLERPAYSYLYAEVPKDNHVFLLNNGNWYRVQDSYAERINRLFEGIATYEKHLPIYDDENEGAYNSRVARASPSEYVLLDKDMVKVPEAASPVEICDLFRYDNEFIHVKRYGGSSVLSHLFNQGLVSGELFQMDSDYRAIVNDKLPPDRKISNPLVRPRSGKYTVVYAIVSESADPLSIPFFSRVSLKHCVSRLEAMGFSVMLAKIGVEETRRVLKKYAGS